MQRHRNSPRFKNSFVRELRTLCRLTQADLARKVGVSQMYVSLIEAGKREPSPEVVQRLRKILGGAVLTPITMLEAR